MTTERPARIVVINHQAANIHSVDKALRAVGADAVVSSSVRELKNADAAVLPGVGASDPALRALERLDLRQATIDFALSGKPLFGVCLGMQLLFDGSEEGTLPGLGLIPGTVVRIPEGTASNGIPLKIPHMGWNAVRFRGNDEVRHAAFRGIAANEYFYFVHSYMCVPQKDEDVAATTEYGSTICAAVARGEIVATQFHPEKSHNVGLQIYRNFVRHAAHTRQKPVGA